MQGAPLTTGFADVPPFDPTALVTALRTDQAGESSFSRVPHRAWQAGVIRYDVDLAGRTVTYCGAEQAKSTLKGTHPSISTRSELSLTLTHLPAMTASDKRTRAHASPFADYMCLFSCTVYEGLCDLRGSKYSPILQQISNPNFL